MKDKIKTWLKAQNHSRDWLGEQIGVAGKTVDNWLSSPRQIPLGKLKLIERLIQEDEAAESTRSLKLLPQNQIFSLEVDLPTFRAYSAAALSHDQTLEQWAIAELNAAADANSVPIRTSTIEAAGKELRLYSSPADVQQTRAAEDPAPAAVTLAAAMAAAAAQIDAVGAKKRGKSAGA